MLRVHFCLLFLGWALTTSAQYRNMNWIFPRYQGLDFSQNPPNIIPNSKIYWAGGASSISSLSGTLLFYTDGDTIWNALHQPMLNGTGLLGSPTHSTISIPHPGNSMLYYIFTTDLYSLIDSSYGEMGYSIVDMNGDNGLGAVVLKNDTLEQENITDKIAATLNQDENSYWVMFHEIWNNIFRAYLLTPFGLQPTPVISSAGSIYWPGLDVGHGQIQFSVSGNILATSYGQQNILQMFHFDNSTGIVSDAIELTVPCAFSDCPRGLEFSKDGSKLYFTTSGLPTSSRLFQLDLSVWDSLTILNSTQLIDSIPLQSGIDVWGTLERAQDDRIYMQRSGVNYLGVINEPNNNGVTCNFVLDGLSIPQSAITLPNQLNSYHDDDVGIPETLQGSGLELYPNPTAEHLALQLPPQWAGKKLELQWHDAHGRLLKSNLLNYAPQVELEVQQFEKGMYLLSLYGDGELLGRESVVLH